MLDQPEKLGRFRVAQRSGRLVKDQEIAFVGYGSGNQDHLLLREGQVLYQRAHVYLDVEALEHLLCLRAQPGPVKHWIAPGVHDQVVEHHVFGDGKCGNQRHIHFLVYDLDAQPFGGQRCA